MTSPLIDDSLVGHRFGRWTVTAYGGRPKRVHTWLCRCDCGTERSVSVHGLKSGQSQSCGCLHRDILRANVTKHGHASTLNGTREYRVWKAMRARCGNPNNVNYKNYGGRGISVCAAWAQDFEAFIRDMGPCPEGHSIDRIDNNGNYEPGNCRWASSYQQTRNYRRCRPVVRDDGTRFPTVADAAVASGVTPNTIHYACQAPGRTAGGRSWEYAIRSLTKDPQS